MGSWPLSHLNQEGKAREWHRNSWAHIGHGVPVIITLTLVTAASPEPQLAQPGHLFHSLLKDLLGFTIYPILQR